MEEKNPDYSVEDVVANKEEAKKEIQDDKIIKEGLKKQVKKIEEDLKKFKDEILKNYKFTKAIGVVPAKASKLIEQEYEIPEQDAKKELIHVLIVIPEKHYKDLAKMKLDAIAKAKKINPRFWIHLLTPVDLWNLGYDSKFDILEAFSMSLPVYDKDFLSSLRVAQIHKSLVLKKFERYVTSYVIGGSFTRDETKSTSDIDVFVVIDDTDVKRMSSIEIKEKIRRIIYSYVAEAEALAGVRNKLSPQIYLLTEFWDAVKDAQPIMFTFIRDGVPLYDRYTFLPWKSLLKMGKIRPSPEAIDTFMRSGDKMEEMVQRKIFDTIIYDLYFGILTPTQGLLMLFGLSPGNAYDTVKTFKELLVEKEKLIEEKYAKILSEIVLDYYKAYEHGKIGPKNVSGETLDRLKANALDYIKRLKKLRNEIEKRSYKRDIEKIYKDVFGMLESTLKKQTETSLIKAFKKEFIDTGKLPPRMLEGLKFIAKLKKELNKKGSKKEEQASSRLKNLSKARRKSSEIINALIEYHEKKELFEKEKPRYLLKGKNETAEVFFTNPPFLVAKGQIHKIINGKLEKADMSELKKALSEFNEQEIKISSEALKTIIKLFSDFEFLK